MTAHERKQDGNNGAGPPARPTRTHLSAAGLRARGWTATMVRQLLGEPDLLRDNPLFRSAPRTRLYRIERVEAAERSEEFRAASAVAARRSAAARSAALRSRREVLARIAAEPLDVPRLTPARLAVLAVAYQARRDGERVSEQREHAGETASVESAGPGTLDRWKVDYLRHRLTRYDDLLADVHGGTGRAAAEELLRRRVYAAISEAYPDLARECERQLRERGGGAPPG